ncbi:uncharacterized protein LOC105844930 [Hydra vulgaris]|uniref:uncharacterized protein LOC105844930 n=1 Tax=Hydra vulgaris TaxID=6087 RepID=UPI0006410105|nr:uncharacterized protein LOC105844930 [Hydra vulgaris]XP_047122851.1 uncharacterized protein LOC105844930 [Hydra vulgaris]XP_047122853.1 uncharacterized protein LOC105844930 [Hydra vulgaris]XP_047122854.1 uncharacterized protein LOC105844930 [Hydra vulgaris]
MQNQKQSTNPEILYKKRCKYIGSIAITTLSQEDRLHFVNNKMLEMKEGSKGIAVILVVTNEGIKAFNERETAVKFAHSISSTAFSTCLPNKRLFAYVARSKQSGGKSIIQAHVFRTKKSRHSHQLSSSVSNAFSIAFSRSETRQKSREQVFQSETEIQYSKSVSGKKSGGKVWAKLEIAKGHDFASHAVLARVKGNSPLQLEKNKSFDKDQLIDIKVKSPTVSLSENTTVSKELTIGSNELSNEELTPDKTEDKRKISSTFTHEIVELNRKDQPTKNNEVKVRANTIDVVNVSERFSGSFFPDSNKTQQYENIVISNKDNDIKSVKLRSHTESLINNHNTFSCNSIETPVDKSVNDILANAEWFQPGFSREIAEEVLEHRSVGSFIIRDSMSHLGCYVITIKVPPNIKTNGFANFLIERVESNFFRIKGFTSTYPTLLDLVTYYGSIEQDIPCRLRLANNNPLFSENINTDLSDKLNINDDSDDDDEYDDPDYEYFNTTDEIMRELQSQ